LQKYNDEKIFFFLSQSRADTISNEDAATIRKSNRFHKSVQYPRGP